MTSCMHIIPLFVVVPLAGAFFLSLIGKKVSITEHEVRNIVDYLRIISTNLFISINEG